MTATLVTIFIISFAVGFLLGDAIISALRRWRQWMREQVIAGLQHKPLSLPTLAQRLRATYAASSKRTWLFAAIGGWLGFLLVALHGAWADHNCRVLVAALQGALDRPCNFPVDPLGTGTQGNDNAGDQQHETGHGHPVGGVPARRLITPLVDGPEAALHRFGMRLEVIGHGRQAWRRVEPNAVQISVQQCGAVPDAIAHGESSHQRKAGSRNRAPLALSEARKDQPACQQTEKPAERLLKVHSTPDSPTGTRQA